MSRAIKNTKIFLKKIHLTLIILTKKYFHQLLGTDKDHLPNNIKMIKEILYHLMIARGDYYKNKWNFFQQIQLNQNLYIHLKAQFMKILQK
jgi:hypothetical protein